MKRGPAFTEDTNPARNKKPKAVTNIFSESILRLVPKDVWEGCIFSFLGNSDLASFSQACNGTNRLVRPVLKKRFQSMILEAVVQGDEEAAKRLIEKNPDAILHNNATVIDYSGKVIKGVTPFQAALLGDDIEMAEMMKPYFEQIEGGETLMHTQVNDIFPHGIEAHRNTQEKAAFDFSEIMQAVIDAPIHEVKLALKMKFDNNIPLHKALDSYRNLFSQVALNEREFNIYHFLKALKQYDEFFDRTDSLERRHLIRRQVVGWTQRYFSACWAQAAVQGVYFIVKDNEKLTRSFKPSRNRVFPLRDRVGLGYNYFLSAAGVRPRRQRLLLLDIRSRDYLYRGVLERRTTGFTNLFQASARPRKGV